MATQQDGPEITLKASATLALYQFHIVTLDTNGRVKLATDADVSLEPMLGVLQNKPTAINQEAVVRVGGTAKVMCGESLDEGDAVTCDASGHAVAAVALDNILGFMLEAGAADKISEVLLKQTGGYAVPA